ncbi:LPP20 family lipoprotein [Psychromonas sp.]|nr:LPP20 family lipoprotein [Psychromonas sp.]
MKPQKLGLFIISSILFFSGCASTEVEKAQLERPNWIDNVDAKYPSNDYLTAIGEGPNRTRAGKNAVANLTETFSVNVRAESKTLTEAVKAESALGVTMESSTTLQRNIETESEQVIQGVEIQESWLSPKGEYYALAVLPRRTAAQRLSEIIIELDKNTAKLIDYSINVSPNSILALNALRMARDEQITRKMADFQLTHISGSGIPNDISNQEIELLIKQKLAQLSISVNAESPSNQSLQAGLASLGMKVVPESNLQLTASIDVLEPAFINDWYWLRGSYELTITEEGQVISRKRWPIKVSAKQKELLDTRLQDKLNSHVTEYLQELVSDSPTL